MKKALFAGTFDPPTHGHLEVIRRAVSLCDVLYVGVGVNEEKRCLFSMEERVEMLKKLTRHLPQINVMGFSGLVVDVAKREKIGFLIRGLRAFSDLEKEFQMAVANRQIGSIETVFLMAEENHAHISSSLIRQLGSYGVRLHAFVPEEIESLVFERLSNV